MNIDVTCPGCKMPLGAPKVAESRQGPCPQCRTTVNIPIIDPDKQRPMTPKEKSDQDRMMANYKGAGFPTTWYLGPVCYVELKDARLDHTWLFKLRKLLLHLLELQSTPYFIVGFAENAIIDSTMIGLLIQLNQTAKKAGGKFGVVVRDTTLLEAFQIVNLDLLMPIFPDFKQALTSKEFFPNS